MIKELKLSLKDFSAVNQTHCFMHVVNLVAKSFLKQFDTKKKCGEANNDNADLEELVTEVELNKSQDANDGRDGEEDDDLNGWVDEVEGLSDEEQLELLESIKLIKHVLFKVSIAVSTYLDTASCTDLHTQP